MTQMQNSSVGTSNDMCHLTGPFLGFYLLVQYEVKRSGFEKLHLVSWNHPRASQGKMACEVEVCARSIV